MTDSEMSREMHRLRQIYQSIPFEQFILVVAEELLRARGEVREVEEHAVLEAVR